MNLTDEQKDLLSQRLELVDIDPELGEVRWKDPLLPGAGKRAKPGARVTCLVIRDSEYKTVKVFARHLIWFAATGEYPRRLARKDLSGGDRIDNLIDQGG
jgi:hypothetical protein